MNRSRSRLGIPVRIGLFVVLLVPLLSGAFGAPIVRGDELSDAVARQKAIQAKIAAQKQQVAQLNGLQADLRTEIRGTSSQLAGINADLSAVKQRIGDMTAKIHVVQATYNQQVAQLADLDSQLYQIQAQEAAKAADLQQRRALLAAHIRAAYDSDRTSLLETILSANSFSDVLADVGYLVDIGNQDKALADQVAKDQQTLFTLDQTVTQTRSDTEQLRLETAAQRQVLARSLLDLKVARAQYKALQAATAQALAIQQYAFQKLARNAGALRRALAAEVAAEAAIKRKIDALVALQFQGGGIPSQYNGTLSWPLAGTITQEFGCTGFPWEPPLGDCSHFHNGIDIADPMYTPIRAAGPGRVVYAGPLSDGAWVVIIAHAQNLLTWYAHVDAYRYPIPVRVGDLVQTGQIIAYVGVTGHTTGPHLHWMVELNGGFVNGRLFL